MPSALKPLPPLAGREALAGRYVLQPRAGVGFATVLARKGQADALKVRVKSAYGLDLPDGPKRVAAGDLAFIGTAPGVWLAMRESGADGLADELEAELVGLASVSDQSGAYAVVRIAGAGARDALAGKFILDLHPRAFGPGDAAVTNFGLINAVVWQLDAEPTFEIAAFRSQADELWSGLERSIGEPGLQNSAQA